MLGVTYKVLSIEVGAKGLFLVFFFSTDKFLIDSFRKDNGD